MRGERAHAIGATRLALEVAIEEADGSTERDDSDQDEEIADELTDETHFDVPQVKLIMIVAPTAEYLPCLNNFRGQAITVNRDIFARAWSDQLLSDLQLANVSLFFLGIGS